MPYTGKGVGYQKTDTSMAAAHSTGSKASIVRDQVMELLAQVFPRALTSEEIARRLNLDYVTVQPRTSELRNAGKIRDSGVRKVGRYGKLIIAWEAA